MSDFIKRLVDILNEGFIDLEETENEYGKVHSELLEYDKLLDFINCDVKKLNKYEDDRLILTAVGNIDSKKEDYEAACYLIESNDENVLNLPQYRNAKSYLETLINYLKVTRDKISDHASVLEKECNDMKLNKKYYEILNCDKPLVLEVDEFVDLLNKENITDYEKKEILSYIIKSNVDNYRKEN